VEKYGVLLNLNERRYYDLQALYYNKNQKRSFPGREQIETYFSRDPAEECRVVKAWPCSDSSSGGESHRAGDTLGASSGCHTWQRISATTGRGSSPQPTNFWR